MSLKRIIALILTAMLALLVWQVPAVAADKELIFDERQALDQADIEELNQLAASLSEQNNLDIAMFLVSGFYAADQTLYEYADDLYLNVLGLDKDGLFVALDEENLIWTWETYGAASGLVGEEQINEAFDAYEEADTYYDGIRDYLLAIDSFLAQTEAVPTTPATEPKEEIERSDSRLIDEVGLLSADEASALIAKLDTVSEFWQFDIVIAIVPALDSRDAALFAADFFEDHGFGFGGTKDGAILLLATGDRDFGFATFGAGIEAFTDAGQRYLDELFLPHLKKDDYFAAFNAFADGVDDFLSRAAEGEPYEQGNIPTPPGQRIKYRLYAFLISLLLSLIIAAFVTGRWKAQLKSVFSQKLANAYIRPGSMTLTGQQDVFLYSNVSRVRRSEEKSGGGGTSTRSSSSGSSFSGHSGKY